MKVSISILLVLLLTACSASSSKLDAAAGADSENLLLATNGTVICNYTSHWSNSWGQYESPLKMIDGNSSTSWHSAETHPQNNVFDLELPQSYRLSAVAVDASSNNNAYNLSPKESPKDVEVWVSTTSIETGYKLVAQFTMDEFSKKRVPVDADARWIRFVIAKNWGSPVGTEIGELEAFGKPLAGTSAPGVAARAKVEGTYNTEWLPIKFTQKGNVIIGCLHSSSYAWLGFKNGLFTFGDESSVYPKFPLSPFIMTASDDGRYINVHSINYFIGKRDDKVNCACSLLPTLGETLASDLQHQSGLLLYGIQFASDSDTIKPESDETLQALSTILHQQPHLKIRVVAHTGADDSNSLYAPRVGGDPTDAANLDLSRRRAQSVAQWLIKKGISGDRLVVSGEGKSKPLYFGVAANRRVEITVIKEKAVDPADGAKTK